jgi:hypothetical protein
MISGEYGAESFVFSGGPNGGLTVGLDPLLDL